jgi:hypothetical protein
MKAISPKIEIVDFFVESNFRFLLK